MAFLSLVLNLRLSEVISGVARMALVSDYLAEFRCSHELYIYEAS